MPTEVMAMPHVVLEGSINLEELFNNNRFFLREGDKIVRLDEILVNSMRSRLLVKATAVEAGVSRSYYISMLLKGSSITVRLDELTDPEKTDSVKISLAVVASMLMKKYGMKVVRTNIGEYLERADTLIK